MASASKPADSAVKAEMKGKDREDLYWVNCNRCGAQMFKARIFLTSCGCLVCQGCGPRVLKDGQCLFCKSSKVSVKPIGSNLTTEERFLFTPLSDLPSFEMMIRTDNFKQKHLDRFHQIHANLAKVSKEKFDKEEKSIKEEEDALNNAEKQLKEKIKKVEDLEQEVMEQEKEMKQNFDSASNTTVGPEMFGAEAGAAGAGATEEKESFTTREGSLAATSNSHFLSF